MRSDVRPGRMAVVGLLGLVLFGVAPCVRAAVPVEKVLPSNTIGYLRVEDVKQLRDGVKASQFGRLLSDPAMKGLIDSVKEKLGDANRSIKGEVGLSLGELASLPQGSISLAILSAQGGAQPVTGLLLVDTGENTTKAVDLLKQLTTKAKEDGRAEVKTEDFKGAALTVIQPKEGGEAKDAPPPMVWTHQGNVIQIATSVEALKDFLSHPDGREDSLASSKAFQVSQEKVGTEGQIFWYLDIEQMLRLVSQMAADQGGNAAQVEAQLQLTGLNGLKAFSGRLGIGVGPYDQFTKTYLYAPGEVQGLLKLFVTPAADLRPQPWVPANIASYQSMSWDLDKMYLALNELVDVFAPGMLGNIEQQLAGPQGDGLSFQKDIFGPLGNRITVISDYKKPVKEDSQRFLIGIALSDPQRFAGTIKKILKLANATPKQREFKGATIYEFETPEVPNAQLPETLSLAIAKDQVFFGERTLLEQVIGGTGPGLADNPAFQAVAKHFPSQSFSMSFQRSDESARVFYDMVKSGQLKDLIREQARQAGQDLPDEPLIDPKLIPDFSVFAKYLTQAGGFGVADENGALFTSFSVKPTTP